MAKQRYYGDKYNQGDFNWTTKFGKKKSKTEGQRLEESGQYLKDPETEVDTSKPLESRMFDIDPKKHKTQQKQKKIRNIAEQGATEGEQAAGKRKLKDQTDLPNFLQMSEKDLEELTVQQQQQRDSKLYGEFDRLVEAARNAKGREKKSLLQRAGRIRKQIETGIDPLTIGQAGMSAAKTLLPDPTSIPEMSQFGVELWQDAKAFTKGAAAGALVDGPLPFGEIIGGVGAVALRRGGKELIERTWDNIGKFTRKISHGDGGIIVYEAVGGGQRFKTKEEVISNIFESRKINNSSGGGKKVGSGQLNLIFPHETSITKPRRGAALIGEEIELISDKSRGLKTRKFIKQDINYNNYRLSNGSYDIDRFERNIRDLLEADQIRAVDVPIGQLHKVKGTTKALKKTVGADAKTIESLYGDYLAGYFNTYGNLDNVARLSTPSGKIVPNVNRDLIRNLRLFRMNPELFYSGGREAFNPKIRTGTYNSQLKQIITENKTTKQFIEGTKLQRHHLAVIDEVWPLFDGLIGNDVDRMRKSLKDLDIFVGNDPKNLSLVPKQFHSIVHDVLWKAFRPSWAGRTGKTKALQLDMKNMNFQERVNAGFVDEFKESMDIINRQLDLGIKEFINRKGNINSKNINELKDFLQTIVDIDMNI